MKKKTVKGMSYEIRTLKACTMRQLPRVAQDMRQEMIDIVSNTGGHIGVNLGVLEITVALHYVFDFLKDNIVFDTGHNCYAHKMLTGRARKMRSMRHHGGLSGFPNPKESPYDLLSSSHAGTALSTGFGLAVAEQLSKSSSMTVAIVGDGSLVEGMAQEALNHIGGTKEARFVIVLNDNEMAIDPWGGGLAHYLKNRKQNTPETYFSSLGIDYVGPVDGHDVETLVRTFSKLKKSKRPVIVHCKTKKGHGLPWRHDDPNQNHWLFPYSTKDGSLIEDGKDYWFKPSRPFMNSIAAEAVYELVKRDKDAVVISPATNGISGIAKIFSDFPKQAIDVAMAEQHSIGFAVGLALKRKKKPIVCFQSAFLPRAFDQLIQELALNKAPVLIVNTRSGIAGLDHEVHHALMDISYLTPLPNLKILFPATVSGVRKTIQQAYGALSGPTMVLYAYGLLGDVDASSKEVRDSRRRAIGAKIGIVTTGNTYKHGIGLQEYFKSHEKKSAVEVLTRLSPRDDVFFARIMKRYQFLISLEENMLRGGLGSMLAEYLVDVGRDNKVMRIGIDNKFMEKGLRSYLYPKYGFDHASIYKKAIRAWGKKFG